MAESYLWQEIAAIDLQITSLQNRRAAIESQIRDEPVPSARDLKITMAYLNDRKRAEIAAEHKITPERVSQIVKKCLPYMSRGLRKFGK